MEGILSDLTRLRRTSWQTVSCIGLPDHSSGQLTHMHFQWMVIGSLRYSPTQWSCRKHEGLTVQSTQIDVPLREVVTACRSSPATATVTHTPRR
jgi:hypothetical protein